MDQLIPINDYISLTPFQAGDKANLVRFLNDPELYNNTLKVPSPYTDIDADEWLVMVREDVEKNGMVSNWAIRHTRDGVIGGIGCFFKYPPPNDHKDEIGYWLAAPYRGQGIMTQVVRAFCNWLFEKRGLVRIEAGVYPHNPASVRVLEKAGFEREGYLRKFHHKKGQLLDSIMLALIRE